MNYFLISYDLRKPDRDYSKLIPAIKEIGSDSWANPLQSVWIVPTTLGVGAVRAKLSAHMDENDGLLVIDVTGSSWSCKGLDDRVVNWLNSYVHDYRRAG